MKYIVFKKTMGPGLHRLLQVSFPNELVHKDVADALAPLAGRPIRAGETTLYSSHGKSETLQMQSDKDDWKLLPQSDYGLHIREDD